MALKEVKAADIPGLLGQDGAVFLPGSTAELSGALLGSLKGRKVVSALVSGLNRFDALAGAGHVTTFFPLPAALTPPPRVVDLQPASYFTMDAHIAGMRPDVAVFQVTPPRADGTCALGLAVDYTETVLAGADIRLAVINTRLPELPGAPRLPLDAFTHVSHWDGPLLTVPLVSADAVSAQIAAHVASVIPDGATLQLGIGKIPAQVLPRLVKRRGLRFHSGIVGEGLRLLWEAGAMAQDDPVVTPSLAGGEDFYAWLRGRAGVRLMPARYTHHPDTLANVTRLHTINSAMEVDVNGNVNAEWLQGRRISSAGGLPDFATAAHHADDGISIIALPSTDASGRHSRIVAALNGPPTVPGSLVDMVITEHGIADLRGCGQDQRRARLVAIAAPSFREKLTTANRA